MSVPPHAPILVFDLGNTRLGMGLHDDDGLRFVQRAARVDEHAWRSSLEKLLEHTPGNPHAAVIASVAPRNTPQLADLIREQCDLDPLVVGRDLPLPIPVDVELPDQLGVDRACAAAAAYERLGHACAVASFGTAITIDCVSDDGRFMGGAILPGLQMSCTALHENTAQLPLLEIRGSIEPLGRNTLAAIHCGVLYGAVGAMREIVERYAAILGTWPHLVLTGGDAPLIAPLADFADAVAPDLCLLGAALAYRRARKPE